MSGYLYITEHGGMPEVIKTGTTKSPIEEALKSKSTSDCIRLWACDWPKKLEEEIHRQFKGDKSPDYKGYFHKSILCSLHLFIDDYLKQDRNFSRETKELLQATKDKRPTRSEMSPEERRFDEISRANEASRVRRKKEGIIGREYDIHDMLCGTESTGKLAPRKLL